MLDGRLPWWPEWAERLLGTCGLPCPFILGVSFSGERVEASRFGDGSGLRIGRGGMCGVSCLLAEARPGRGGTVG